MVFCEINPSVRLKGHWRAAGIRPSLQAWYDCVQNQFSGKEDVRRLRFDFLHFLRRIGVGNIPHITYLRLRDASL